MKLYTVLHDNTQKVCVLAADGKLAVLPCETMNGLLVMDEAAREKVLTEAASKDGELSMDEVKLLAPIPQPLQDVLCLGMNYQAHKNEAERYHRKSFTREEATAVYFSKRVNACPASGDAIEGHFDITERLDYENELGVIIGKDAKNVAAEDAFSYVFGYTIVNDMSARDLQTGHKQWYFGKSLDDSTPMGPCIVTKDEFSCPPALALRTYINGELRQNACTDQLIFDIPYVIHELSQGMTLKAGTVIATGTPAGVGLGFEPPRFLKSGDVIRCEIEGIGVLENTVK